MKKNLTYLTTLGIILSLLASCTGTSTPKESTPPPHNAYVTPQSGTDYEVDTTGYTLVWQDEFNGPEIDTSVWSYETEATGWSHTWNSEWQDYVDNGTGGDNAYIQDDALVIKAEYTGTEHAQGSYTSARMVTKNTQSWKYGKVVARMSLPYGKGMWPAFWLMGNDGDWPACGEIDVMELVGGGSGDRTVHSALHWQDGGHKTDKGELTINNLRDYHIYELNWTDDSIEVLVDGDQCFYIDTSSATMDEFDQNFYLLLNLAVGGAWGGYPDETTAFPQYFMIDWIRVYQEN